MIYCDFETRSECDLPARGAYNYALDRSTRVLCLAWAIDDGEVQIWAPGQEFPKVLADAVLAGQRIVAHNAAFERLIWTHVLGPDHGTPVPALEQFYCTATQARANCAPGSLEDVGRFAGASMRKDHRGPQLVRKCCCPPFKHTPQDLQDLFDYCVQDVRAMRAVSQALRPLSDDELADYHVNERINDRGVLVDVGIARAAQAYAADELEAIQHEVIEVTGGAVTSVRSPRMRAWVLERLGPEARKLCVVHKDGEAKDSIDKSVRAALLVLAEENPDEVPPDVAQVIQAADDLWASSAAKFGRMANLADDEDHRVRGAFVFAGGSATGRACVSADTMIETENGSIPISALKIGQKVLTHAGRFCKISRVIYKGREIMYRVRTSYGGWVDCTEQHLLLTAKGWKSVKELIGYQQSPGARASNEIVYVAAVSYDGASSRNDAANARDCWGNRAGDSSAGSAKNPQSGELFQIEDGRQESYVWGAEPSGSHLAQRVSLPVDGGRILARASAYRDASVWPYSMARGLGNSSHRQQQTEQLARQLGDCDPQWASAVALTEITEVVCLGEKGVWDITVEGDASYVAQGLIHHNSSYGLQAHNFPRVCASDPEAARAAMIARAPLAPAFGRRVTDVLKSMLRPSLMPSLGKQFVVADWSAIEGRVHPWLSNCPAGEDKLDVFRSKLDPYKVNAAATFGTTYETVTKDQRQVGKVQELALGFLGGPGAFDTFGRVYGVKLSDGEVARAVAGWRRANPWAMAHGQALESAYTRAMRNPHREFHAGRVAYLFDGQHLWYALPSGRVLCYPFARLEEEGVTYAKASWKPAADAKEWPRARLWRGLACENVTQAVANDILRHSLRQLEPLGVVLHVHDEVVIETDAPEAVQAEMQRVMTTPPAWAEGLPLAIEADIVSRYAK